MTDPSLLKVGDKVFVSVKSTGDPYEIPKNTPGVVWGFANEVIYTKRMPDDGIEPGAYCRRNGAKVWLPDGRILDHWHALNISLMDHAEEMRRSALEKPQGDIRLGDLPDTEFWEGDIVGSPYHSRAIVAHINYWMVQGQYGEQVKLNHEAYKLEDTRGSRLHGSSRLTLIERGNAWRYYHDEPLKFTSSERREEFLARVGGGASRD